ncbi:acetyl-CoA synthetase-like protein [Basidiobolus meristosporus CBS 931.73]|uniref:Acetyl-CoA synthetase-like protein n=1 Tax=Basidiobolus meristosporus CBS 931.73 TaxID=1314790 RepID=A0A1Y1XUT0_9FUNG|nr:acetyl-CoA synthetase-like protein [Basidiobolus meristosporus CBS 931.73]|eukprot:ORX89509.1 acetyl-CoA synthetase-like protein [Basidiobolus meristosporus CBS 931.73]
MNHTLVQSEQQSLLEALLLSMKRVDKHPTLPVIYSSTMCALMFRYTNSQVFSLHIGSEQSQVSISLCPDMSLMDLLKVTEDRIVTSLRGRHLSISELAIRLYVTDSSPVVNDSSEIQMHISSTTGQVIDRIGINKSLLCSGTDVVGHWNELLRRFVDQPDVPISEVVLLPPVEAELLTSDGWATTSFVTDTLAPSVGVYLHTVFENTSKMYPGRTAILFEKSTGQDEVFTYQEVEAISTTLAKYLHENHPTGPGVYIGLLMPQKPTAYIAMLAILKTGSAYVPIDPACPSERIEYILGDSQAGLLLCEREAVRDNLPCQTLALDDWLAAQSSFSESFKLPSGVLQVADPAYMIYTSGTTGRPKGVVVEHQNVVSLVNAEYSIFKLNAEDRVYQQFSLSFDASIEEIWLPFRVGGTLVPATQKPGPGLSETLEAKGVTVLSCVPTLLTMLPEDEKLRSLRLLILGGEACPKSVVERFGIGCRIVNSYGPTETTVIATWKECNPTDDIVTIGRPIPGYSAFIMSAHNQLQPVGVAGELVIGGPGVTRGYHNLPELTRSKYIKNTSLDSEGRLYKTGDLARFNAAGEIEYLGRIDTQVKLRGFRIELAEVSTFLLYAWDVLSYSSTFQVESALQACEGIQLAVATVDVDVFSMEHLVAYVVPTGNEAFLDFQAIKDNLQKKMPSFMVPSTFQVIQDVPTLPSGKIDRKSLPKMSPDVAVSVKDESKPTIAPRTPTEAKLVDVWTRYFNGKAISVSDNFFDLGGHSLFAAMLISELRSSECTKGISMGHIYQFPVLENLAAFLDTGLSTETRHVSKNSNIDRGNSDVEKLSNLERVDFPPTPSYLHTFGRMICQLAAILTVFLVTTLPVSILYMLYKFTETPLAVVLVLFALDFCWMAVIVVALKWILIGRYREGKWPLWGAYYWRWWVVRSCTRVLKLYILEGSPLLNLFYNLMGAKIHMTAYVGTRHVYCFDLVTIREEASIGLNAYLNGYKVENGWLIIGAGNIVGAGARVGNKSHLGLNAELQDGASLDDLSVLQDDQQIPTNERWAGSPAKLVEHTNVRDKEDSTSQLTIWIFCLLHFIAAIFVNIAFGLLASLTDCHYQISLEMTNSIYGTLYAPHWLRALGAKIGKASEVSTITYISPDLLRIGDGCFLADSVIVGPPYVRHGKLSLDYATVEERSFVGNGALFPAGVTMGKDCLLGVLSTPGHDKRSLEGNSSWLGSPSMYLPNRQAATKNWPKERTYAPSNSLYIVRYLMELWRVFLPNMVNITAFVIVVMILELLYERTSSRKILSVADEFMLSNGLFTNLSQGGLIASFLPIFLIVNSVVAAGACGFVLIMKWILIGTYAKREVPLWSSFVWRTELITALQEGIANRQLLQNLRGTPLVCFWFRMLGSQIGDRVWMDTLQITEADLIHIDDDVCIGEDTILQVDSIFALSALAQDLNNRHFLQTHLFEDRIMKMDSLKIGCRSNVGSSSVILYGSTLEEGVSIGALSLVMKGERLPSHTGWNGIPLSNNC